MDLPKPRNKVIAFPTKAELQNTRKVSSHENLPCYSDWRKNFNDSGFADYNYVGHRILWALYDLRINSLGELANTPPGELMKRRNVGKKTIAIIKAVLEKNGFVLGEKWDINHTNHTGGLNKNKHFDKADIIVMSPITQRLDALLKAEGFTALNAGHKKGGNNINVNRLEYMNEKEERVFLITHELPAGPIYV